jgi:hypothetical protein
MSSTEARELAERAHITRYANGLAKLWTTP